MAETYVGAIDQGTTGTRFAVFDRGGRAVGEAYRRHEQYYPEPGWVEHDPVEIWENARVVIREALSEAGVAADRLAAIGVANQRETTLFWDADSGRPIHRAIVWQDRRTTDRIERLEAEGKADAIRATTGLHPDAYFSATKAEWLLDNADPPDHYDEGETQSGHTDADAGAGADVRARAERGELHFGTIDAWLIERLTGAHVTDVTNASRTMLFDIRELAWDDELLAEFRVPAATLPEVRPSSDEEAYGTTDPDGFLGAEVPVAGALGDQQAALFGHACFDAGDAKNTYGTGSFVLLNTGEEAVASDNGLLTTVGFKRSGEPVRYALEGSIFTTGAAVEWLEDVSLIDDVAETEALARRVDSPDGVYVVPAFAGLGAPHWDQRARGTILGLTRGTRREHVVRATLEAIGFQTRDVAEAMERDSGIRIDELRVDGGAVRNDLLCELQADVLGADVVRPAVEETTALGAAYAAGLAVSYWETADDLRDNWRVDRTFEGGDPEWVDRRYGRWAEAVERAGDWARENQDEDESGGGGGDGYGDEDTNAD